MTTAIAPRITIDPQYGKHNSNLGASNDRLIKGSTYKDLSTVCIIPSRGLVPITVVQTWWALVTPMNQKFCRLVAEGMEVGEAYTYLVGTIQSVSELDKWKYILTLEEDNMPPADGLLKLYESIEGKVDGQKYDAVGGVYWTKGEGGQPMIYGNPKEQPMNFRPQLVVPESVQECNGLGMGFTLFRAEMFKDKRLPKPWFQTKCEPGQMFTQDLWFFNNAKPLGYRFASDNRVRVGHYDHEGKFGLPGTVW